MGFNEAKYKKVYIGDKGGKAKLLYAPKGAYGFPLTGGSYICDSPAASIGNYAIFSYSTSKTVEVYDSSLTCKSVDDLDSIRYQGDATSVGDYAIFAGGFVSNTPVASAESYDKNLTHKSITNLSTEKKLIAATTVGNYAIFAGGQYLNSSNSAWTSSNTVDYYNASLTKSTTTLSTAMTYITAASVGNYALFVKNGSTTVNAYNTSLTRTNLIAPVTVPYGNAAATAGKYAIFAGGCSKSDNSGTRVSTVFSCDSSLTFSNNVSSLSTARRWLAGVGISGYALFGGGETSSSTSILCSSGVVDAYDSSLTRSISTSFSNPRHNISAATTSNYAIFSQGSYSTGEDGKAISTPYMDAYFIL